MFIAPATIMKPSNRTINVSLEISMIRYSLPKYFIETIDPCPKGPPAPPPPLILRGEVGAVDGGDGTGGHGTFAFERTSVRDGPIKGLDLLIE